MFLNSQGHRDFTHPSVRSKVRPRPNVVCYHAFQYRLILGFLVPATARNQLSKSSYALVPEESLQAV
jgi:hypothetical protein